MTTTRLSTPLAQQIYDSVQEVRMSLWVKGLDQQSIAFLPILLLAYSEGLLNGAESAKQIAERLINLAQEQKDTQTKDALAHLKYLAESIDKQIGVQQLIEPFKYLNSDSTNLLEACKEVIEEMFQEPAMLSFGLMADVEVNYAIAVTPDLSETSSVLVTSANLFGIAIHLANSPQVLFYDPIVTTRSLMSIRARIHHAQQRVKFVEYPLNSSEKTFDLILTHFSGAKVDLTFDKLVSINNLDDENQYDNLFKALSPSGKIILFTHSNLLSSVNFTRYRSQWINRKLVESVCSFEGIKRGKTKTSQAIVLFSHEINENVFLINGNAFRSEKFGQSDLFEGIIEVAKEKKVIPEKSCYVESNSLTNFHYSLLPEVLLLDWYPEHNPSRFNNYLKLIPFNSVKEINQGKVLTSDLWSDDTFGILIQSSDLEENQVPEKFRKLSQSAILVHPKRVRGIAKYFKYSNEDIYIGPGYLVFEVFQPQIDPLMFVEFINSDSAIKFVHALQRGTIIPSLRVEDFLRIPIHFKSKIRNLNEDVVNSMGNIVNEPMSPVYISKAHQKDENHALLRHTLAGPLSNLQGAVERIDSILRNQVIKNTPNLFELKANPNHEMNLGSWLDLMRSEVEVITQFLSKKNSDLLEILEEPLIRIDLASFLTSYVSQLNTDSQFESRMDIDDSVFFDDDEMPRTLHVLANEKLLRTLLDNLVENAVKHAFKGQSGMHIDFCLRYDADSNSISLDVSNSGYPFPPNFDYSIYWRKGGKASISGGDGLGGWIVGQIINRLNLIDYEIYDEVNGLEAINDPNISTTFWFYFKVVN